MNWPLDRRPEAHAQSSKEAWQMWMGHQTILINENRLSPMDPKQRAFIEAEMEKLIKKCLPTYRIEKKIGDELVIVPVASEVAQMNKVFSLNEVGLYIYEQLIEPKSEEEVINLVCKEFDVSKEIAQIDIKSFLTNALKASIIKMIE